MIKDIVQDVVVDTLADVVVKNSFEVLDLSPVIWLDATDSSTLTLSGSNVTQWDDKSGNDNHVSQATGSLQPLYDGFGVSSTGGVSYMDSVSAFSSRTVFAVGKYEYDGSTNLNFVGSAIGGREIFFGSDDSGGFRASFDGSASGTGKYSINNNSESGFSANPSVVNDYEEHPICFFGEFNVNVDIQRFAGRASVNNLNTTIYEIIWFDRVLTETEKAQVRNYLIGKHGCSTSEFMNNLTRLAHWDSTRLDTLTLSGSNVTQWDDISGNGYDVVQATGADQPTLESGGVRFTNDHLTGVGNNVGSEYSIFLVAKNNTDNPGDLRYYFGTGGGGGTASLHFGRRLNFYRLSNGTNHVDISNIPSIGDTFLYSITNTTSGSSIKLNNGTSETGVTVPVTGNTNYEIGSGFLEGSRELLDSFIYEILIIEETDATTIQNVTYYLANKHQTERLPQP